MRNNTIQYWSICRVPTSNNQADEGISLKLAQYLEPLGEAPVSEACKHLYSVYQAARKILIKLGGISGLTAHCSYLTLEGDPSGVTYNLVLDKAAYKWSRTDQGILVEEIVEVEEVQDTVVVHTYTPTGRRTKLGKSRVWKPVYSHVLSGRSVPIDKSKCLMDFSQDFDRVKFKQIISVRESQEKLLSVRDMDMAVAKLLVSVRSL